MNIHWFPTLSGTRNELLHSCCWRNTVSSKSRSFRIQKAALWRGAPHSESGSEGVWGYGVRGPPLGHLWAWPRPHLQEFTWKMSLQAPKKRPSLSSLSFHPKGSSPSQCLFPQLLVWGRKPLLPIRDQWKNATTAWLWPVLYLQCKSVCQQTREKDFSIAWSALPGDTGVSETKTPCLPPNHLPDAAHRVPPLWISIFPSTETAAPPPPLRLGMKSQGAKRFGRSHIGCDPRDEPQWRWLRRAGASTLPPQGLVPSDKAWLSVQLLSPLELSLGGSVG